MDEIRRKALFLRNFIFGVEDSLVSTVGLLSGVAVAGTDTKTIVLAGIVLIFVEAFSMGVGSLLSDNTEEEYMAKKDLSLKQSILPSMVMFISYFIAGFVPLAPYLLLDPVAALPISIGLSLAALFVLGLISGSLSKAKILKNGIQMMVIGGVAVALGVVVGIFVDTL